MESKKSLTSLLVKTDKFDVELDNLFNKKIESNLEAGNKERAITKEGKIIKQQEEETEEEEEEDVYDESLSLDEDKENVENLKELSTKENKNDNSSKSNKNKVELSKDEIEVKSNKPGKDDIEEQRRTIFVGNISIDAMKKSGKKQLIKLFSRFGKVESVRFRSLALEKPMNRKVAYIKNKLNAKRTFCNAYIKFEKEESVEKSLELNGTIFLDKHIRVDTVFGEDKTFPPKRSIFVGNLDFEIEDEPLWLHFEKCGKIEAVRVIRDPKTNLGKGFAYILFEDSDAAQLAIKLNGSEVDGREIRVTGCKKILNKDKKTSVKAKAIAKNGDKNNYEELFDGPQVIIEGERASKSTEANRRKRGSKTKSDGVRKKKKPSKSSKNRAKAWKAKKQ